MIIGVPKEIKNNENRIALTPAGASELVKEATPFMFKPVAVSAAVFQ
jgi:alanine dehydrogenase